MLDKEGKLTSPEVDLRSARDYAITLAGLAGARLKEFFGGGFSQRQKAGIDFTTEADETIDNFIRRDLARYFPQTKILSEEAVEEQNFDPKQIDNLWIVDPLDGTINFSRGHHNFAISIGLVSRGSRTKLGVIHLPFINETYWAQEDQEQAFVNGRPIQVSKINKLRKALVAIDWPYDLEHRKTVLRWAKCFAPHVLQIRSSGSAVSDLALVAAGKIDAYVQLGTKPWDTAAGALLVEKAGGMVTTPEGGAWNPFNHMILATNGVLHDEIVELLKR